MARRSWLLLALIAGAAAYAAGTENGRQLMQKSGLSLPGSAPQKEAARPARPPSPVNSAKVQTKTLPLRLEGVGAVQARATVSIKSRVDGQLVETHVRDGQVVKKGDLLFTLDRRPFEALVRQADANVTRDTANLAKAKSDFERADDLVGKGVSPRARLDDTLAGLKALEATVSASKAALEVAKLNLEYTVIKAPIAGRIGGLLVATGNMIKANDTQPLLVINEIDPVYVAFAVPERYLRQVRDLMAKGTVKVKVWAPGSEASAVTGDLFFMNNAVDTNTGTILLMASFQNADQRLLPGQFVHASAEMTALDNAVVVSTQTLQVGQRGTFVYVVKDDMTVEMRPVTTGPTVDGFAVIEKGLKVGEVVVTEGQLRLFPGAKVVLQNPNANGRKPKEQS